MYENKIDSDKLNKAVNQYVLRCVGENLKFPVKNYFYSMSTPEQQVLMDWIGDLDNLGLKAIFHTADKKEVVVQNKADFEKYNSLNLDLFFSRLEIDPALSAHWLYDFYCEDLGVTKKFESKKLKNLFIKVYQEVDLIGKRHFLKVAVEKNFFVVLGLCFALLSVLLASIQFLCFIFIVCVVMSAFLQLVLAKRIYDEQIAILLLQKLKDVGLDEDIQSIVISNFILVNDVNKILKNDNKRLI